MKGPITVLGTPSLPSFGPEENVRQGLWNESFAQLDRTRGVRPEGPSSLVDRGGERSSRDRVDLLPVFPR